MVKFMTNYDRIVIKFIDPISIITWHLFIYLFFHGHDRGNCSPELLVCAHIACRYVYIDLKKEEARVESIHIVCYSKWIDPMWNVE